MDEEFDDNIMNEEFDDNIRGGIYGLLIGDAAGVPYEIKTASEVATLGISFPFPAQYDYEEIRSHAHAPKNAWSDDGAQALCLLASLLDKKRLDLDDFAIKLLKWHTQGYLAVDQYNYGSGGTTRAAFEQLQAGIPAEEAGIATEKGNGNGALMRVLPLVLWHVGDSVELARLAMHQSKVTHGHIRSQLCCALYCLWARGELLDDAFAFDRARDSLARMGRDGRLGDRKLILPELWDHVLPTPAERKGTSYVVDCLHTAKEACARTGNYRDTIEAAIGYGNDTDTTAAVAGGIAGIRYGIQGIPSEWMDTLAGKDLVEPLVDRLLER